MSNQYDTVLYVGVTTDLHLRMHEHKNKVYEKSFTAKYNCNKLIYCEQYHELGAAFDREKEIKGRTRKKKLDLIMSQNPTLEDLSAYVAS